MKNQRQDMSINRCIGELLEAIFVAIGFTVMLTTLFFLLF